MNKGLTIALHILLTIFVFTAIDLVWLAVMIPNFYLPNLGDIIAETPNLWAALAFYILFPSLLYAMVIYRTNPLRHKIVYGALFGLATYATYNLTNLSLLQEWSLTVVIVDMIWGAALSSLTAMITGSFLRKQLPQCA